MVHCVLGSYWLCIFCNTSFNWMGNITCTLVYKHYITIHLSGQNLLKSNYGPESEYITFFALESEYNYPVTEIKLSPHHIV